MVELRCYWSIPDVDDGTQPCDVPAVALIFDVDGHYPVCIDHVDDAIRYSTTKPHDA